MGEAVTRVPGHLPGARYAPHVSEDVVAVERELCRIPEVRAARIVVDSGGAPVEVHVLAVPGKHAKQIVRDVQSVAMATVGMSIDHRIVSVVQLDDPVAAGAAGPVAAPADEDEASPPIRPARTRLLTTAGSPLPCPRLPRPRPSARSRRRASRRPPPRTAPLLPHRRSALPPAPGSSSSGC